MSYQGFKELETWKQARQLRKEIYVLTRNLPASEKFNLISQMRRAALSVTSNIAEGHGRFHFQENIQFLRHARGSLEELMDQLTLCEDEQFSDPNTIQRIENLIINVRKLVNGYIRFLKSEKTAASVREFPTPYKITVADEKEL